MRCCRVRPCLALCCRVAPRPVPDGPAMPRRADRAESPHAPPCLPCLSRAGACLTVPRRFCAARPLPLPCVALLTKPGLPGRTEASAAATPMLHRPSRCNPVLFCPANPMRLQCRRASPFAPAWPLRGLVHHYLCSSARSMPCQAVAAVYIRAPAIQAVAHHCCRPETSRSIPIPSYPRLPSPALARRGFLAAAAMRGPALPSPCDAAESDLSMPFRS